jgi:S-adenosylmethionine-diacylgycerolhomoserine-N-methlytransferase
MSASEAVTLWRLLRGMPGNADHAHRLQAFYGAQANDYDRFRERLLPGRAALMEWLKPAPFERIVELGAGTGRNPEFLRASVPQLASLTLVDLCPALLLKARERWADASNVQVIEADACTWRPDEPVDAVYFSYALTMIPDWRAALDNAISMLRPGGRLAVVDFTLTQQQSWLAQTFWRKWFGHDGVNLDLEHLKALKTLLPVHELRVQSTQIPYLPGVCVPYYLYLGIKKQDFCK